MVCQTHRRPLIDYIYAYLRPSPTECAPTTHILSNFRPPGRWYYGSRFPYFPTLTTRADTNQLTINPQIPRPTTYTSICPQLCTLNRPKTGRGFPLAWSRSYLV